MLFDSTAIIARHRCLVQLALVEPESKGGKDFRIFVIQFDNLMFCFGKAIVEGSLEVSRRVAKQLLVDVKAFDVCSRADNDLGSRASGQSVSANAVSKNFSREMSFRGVSHRDRDAVTYKSDILGTGLIVVSMDLVGRKCAQEAR